MPVRPFALLAGSTLEAARLLLFGALERWSLDWGLGQADIALYCARASEAQPAVAPGAWQRRYAGGGKSAWFAWQGDFPKHLQRQMFGADQHHGVHAANAAAIAAETAAAALDALTEALAMRALPAGGEWKKTAQDAVPHASEFAQGSGAVMATVKVKEQSFFCLLNLDCMRAMAAAPKAAVQPLAKVNYRKAFHTAALALPVEIGQAEVSVASLMALELGDVIRLNTSVDKPLAIRGLGSEVLFGGHLGTLENMVAIEVVRREK